MSEGLDLCCDYCGHKFNIQYLRPDRDPVCPKCGDKNLRKLPKSDKVDYYAGDIQEDDPYVGSDWSD